MKLKIFIVAACMVCAGIASQARGEYVFLRDGKIIEGKIIGESALTVTVRTKDRKVETFTRGTIMRLLYTNLYMGKVHVQKRDGKNFEAYQVDEDQNTYTFRKNLHQPQEMVINRSDVLFMSQMNPSGLKGKAETDRVRLEWFPPYNDVDRYNVYMMKKNGAEFKNVGHTGRVRFTVNDLSSNSVYLFKVTAVDESGTESLPSNEIELKTKNIPPPSPSNLRIEQRDVVVAATDKRGRALALRETRKFLVWDPVRDVDGTIREYRVYNTAERQQVRLAAVRENMFEMPQGLGRGDIEVRAVDDTGDESCASGMSSDWTLELGARWHYLSPIGRFADMWKTGGGLTISAAYSGFMLPEIVISAEIGVFSYKGKENFSDDDMYLDMLFACLNTGYRFTFFDSLHVTPVLGGGFIKIEQGGIGGAGAWGDSKISSNEMMLFTGLDCSYDVFSWCAITAGVRLYVIPEEEYNWSFLSYSAGLTFML